MKLLYRSILTLILLIATLSPIFTFQIALGAQYVCSYSTNSDGVLYDFDAVYNTAWTASSGTADDDDTSVTIGQKLDTDYYIYRSAFYFDTSLLPDSATVTSATLRLYGVTDSSDTDFDITIQSGMPTYPTDPMVAGDYDKSNYSGDWGTLNTSSFSTSGYNDIDLNSTGMAGINLTGTTKLMIRSSREIAGTTPTGDEYITVYTSEYTGQDYDPHLLITYTTTTSYVATRDAYDITTTTATMQGEVINMAGESYGSVFFEYGLTTSYGYTTTMAQITSAGIFTADMAGLSSYTEYHYRAGVRFGDVTFYGDDYSFTTLYSEGASDDLVIVQVAVFSGYYATGDLLFCVETKNTYPNYYPNLNAGQYFHIQLLDTDGTTVIGASALSNWGDRPTAIYVNATQASGMVDEAEYTIRMIGVLVTSNPYEDYTLTAYDWRGANMDALDDWCISVATNMQISDGRTDYLSTSSTYGVIITDEALAYFTEGIPNINIIRPNLFETSQYYPDFPYGDADNQWDSDTAWSTNVGTNIATDVAVFGVPFGVSGKDFLSAMVVMSMIFPAIFVTGHMSGRGALGGFLIAVPILWVGTYFKIVPIIILAFLLIIFALAFIRQFIVKTL